MLASIHPLGERARHNRWAVTAGWYVAGSVAAGSALGATLAATVGAALAVAGWHAGPVLAAALCVAAGLADAAGWRGPGPRRQVDERWLARYRGWAYGLGFGLQLGLGIVTIVTSAAVYLTFVLAALSGSPTEGAVIGGAFGLARALPIGLVARARSAPALRRTHRRLAAAGPWAARLTIAGLFGAAAGAVR
jgi:hypothetical protein